MTIMLAGHETIATTLSWLWYLVSQNPEVESRLHDEVDSVLEGRLPEPEDVERLVYTRQVFAEALRLYPALWSFGRRTIQPIPVGDYVIPVGTYVMFCPYVTHRNPKYFPDPERFDPDRWTDAFRVSLPRFAYFPFGGGPRICIGEGFAWAEAMIVLATLAGRWSARLVSGHPVELQPLITLRPRHGLRMTLRLRTAPS